MTPNTEENNTMIKYLLGDLSDVEQAAIEERFFSDEEYHERLRSVETDLIDCYSRGELSSGNKTLFERRYLISPERQQRARFAGALTVLVDEAGVTGAPEAAGRHMVEHGSAAGRMPRLLGWLTGSSPAWRVAWASAMAVLLVAVVWLWVDARRTGNQVALLAESRDEVTRLRDQLAEQSSAAESLSADLESERRQRALESQRAEELEKQVSRLEQERAAGMASRPVLSFLLSPGISRTAEEPDKLEIPAGTRVFRLQLELLARTDYTRFQAEVRTAGGTVVWNKSHFDRQARREGAVALSFPATRFPAGEYELTLKGVSASGQIEDIGYYYFRIATK